MDAQIARGEIAAAAVDRAEQRARADLGDQPGTDRVAIGAAASQLDDQIVAAAGRFVPEHDAGRVVMDDDQVEVAVAVEVAAGQPAAQVQGLEVRRRRRR